MNRIKPLKRGVDKVLRVLAKEGFHLASGSDSGWFGDGMYVLTNGRESVRITRSRNEEFLDVAFKSNPAEQDWLGIAELMVAVGDLAFEEVVNGRAIPHDLDFKLKAYLRIQPQIRLQLGQSPEVHEKVVQLRQRSKEYAQMKYGRQS